MKKSDLIALMLLVTVLCGIGAYYFGYRGCKPRMDELDNEIAELQARYDDLKAKEAKRDWYIEETKRLKQEFEDELTIYPADLNQESTVIYLKGTEEMYDTFKNITVGLPMEAAFYTIGASATANETGDIVANDNQVATEPYVCTKCEYPINFTASYEQLKDYLDYVAEYKYRMNISQINMSYDPDTELLIGSLALDAYAISGPDRVPDVPVVDEQPQGVDNMFLGGEGAVVSADASKYDVYYTAYVQDYGWLNWAKNGEISGTVGLSKRIEGIEVVVLNKGATVPRPLGKVTKSSYNASDLQNPHIQYKVHQQNAGWSKKVQDGIIAGTTGKSLRLEALKVNLTADNLKNTTTSVTYRTHVQNKGWTSWSNNNQTSGTTGQSKRLEAVQIKLNNSISEQYDIYYAVHVQNYGWLGWAKNSETAGTQGYGLRTEAIAIKLIPKGESAPQQLGKISAAELTSDYFKKNYTISYRSHVQKIGWQSWLSADQTSGTTGQSLQMEALQIKLSDTVLGDSSILYRAYVQDKGTETDWTDSRKSDAYSGTTGQGKRIEAVQIKLQGNASSTMNVWYRVHSENYGWLGWTKNGEWAGTSNGGLRAEAVQICVLPKTAAAPGSTDQPYVSLSTVKTGSLGVDVSEWQGYISADNWRKAKNAGYSFAMLRIAWGHAGNGAMDKQFNNNYANATSAGMPFGVYVYSYADTEEEARQEADYAISLLDGRSLKMPICIDLEDDRISYLSKTQQSKNAIAFCEEVKKAGYTPMIYANQNWLNNHLDYSMIKNYKIWYAQYPYSWSSYSKPSYNNHIDIWQYSDRGNVPGLSGSIDMNKAYSNF